MKKKRKNKGRKTLTAMGAMVAAGLTPGIVSGAPVSQQPDPDVELTAADVVSINGDVFDFDDLFAMRQVNRGQDRPKLVYGPPPSSLSTEEEKNEALRQERERERQREEEILRYKAQQEALRQDSIRRALENQKCVYGPPPPRFAAIGPEELRIIASTEPGNAFRIVSDSIMQYCIELSEPNTKDIVFSNEGNLVKDLKMNSKKLKKLSEAIERRFGVQLTENMLKQLGSVERIANFIVQIAKPIEE